MQPPPERPFLLKEGSTSEQLQRSAIRRRPTLVTFEQRELERFGGDVSEQPTHAMPPLSTPRAQLSNEELLQRYTALDEDLSSDLLNITSMSTIRLMQVSGRIQVLRLPARQPGEINTGSLITSNEKWLQNVRQPLPQQGSDALSPASDLLGPVPGANRAGEGIKPVQKRSFLQTPTTKIILSLLLGIALLALIARFIDIPLTLRILSQHLTTPRGILYALAAGLALSTAYCIRGARWQLFLRSVGKVSVIKAIQLFWVAIFINFILPVQGGELAKSLMLKRITGIPISRSLPTVAMDKALDLLPALFIMALAPFVPGLHMSPTIWLLLGSVGSILVGLIFMIILMALSRTFALRLIKLLLRPLPKQLSAKIEGFALGFIDAILAGASQPKIFLPAILLTLLAVSSDGLFALFAFWAVGVDSMNFGVAIFGYAVYTLFYILPTPPGHVGSNEFAGVVVFSTLLGYKQNAVLAMFLFSHPLGALIMGIGCILSLAGLGLTFANALNLKPAR